jgi:L-threonylcarbamoyladenylate synthase
VLPLLSHDVQRQIDAAVAVLLDGGIVAYPTDTVYGLGASMSIPAAVERVFAAKRRTHDMALPLLVADSAQMAGLASRFPPVARLLVERFLPGALTLVLPASDAVPGIVTAGGKTVAVRIPDHPVPLELIRGIGAPLVGTSANVSGKPSPLTAAETRAQLGEAVDMVVDDGRRCPGTESTIVDVSSETPVVLREGAIPKEDIEQAVREAR